MRRAIIIRILPLLLPAAGCGRQAEQDCDTAFEARRGTSTLHTIFKSDTERKQALADCCLDQLSWF